MNWNCKNNHLKQVGPSPNACHWVESATEPQCLQGNQPTLSYSSLHINGGIGEIILLSKMTDFSFTARSVFYKCLSVFLMAKPPSSTRSHSLVYVISVIYLYM